MVHRPPQVAPRSRVEDHHALESLVPRQECRRLPRSAAAGLEPVPRTGSTVTGSEVVAEIGERHTYRPSSVMVKPSYTGYTGSFCASAGAANRSREQHRRGQPGQHGSDSHPGPDSFTPSDSRRRRPSGLSGQPRSPGPAADARSDRRGNRAPPVRQTVACPARTERAGGTADGDSTTHRGTDCARTRAGRAAPPVRLRARSLRRAGRAISPIQAPSRGAPRGRRRGLRMDLDGGSPLD